MRGCVGCLPGESEKQNQLKETLKKAKQYAVDIEKLVVIYTMDDGTASYMEAEAAKEAQICPIQFVSHLQPVNNG